MNACSFFCLILIIFAKECTKQVRREVEVIFTPEHDSIQASSSNCVFIYFLHSVSFDYVDSSQLTTQKYWRSYFFTLILVLREKKLFSSPNGKEFVDFFSAKSHLKQSKKLIDSDDHQMMNTNFFIFLSSRKIWNSQADCVILTVNADNNRMYLGSLSLGDDHPIQNVCTFGESKQSSQLSSTALLQK